MPMNSSPNMALGAGMNYGPQNPNPGGLAGLLNQIPRGWQIPKGNTGVFAHSGSMPMAGNNPGLPGWHPWMKDLKAPQNPMAGGMNYGQQSGMGGLESVLNAYSPKMKTGPY